MTNVITVKNLRKSYGTTVAVDDISFAVAQGEIFAILGPNGAGKTTTVETIIGLRRPDRGDISILGVDVYKRQVCACLSEVSGQKRKASCWRD